MSPFILATTCSILKNAMVTEQAIKLNISRALRPLGSLRWSRFMDTEYPAWTSMLLMVFSKSLGEDDAVPTADPGKPPSCK